VILLSSSDCVFKHGLVWIHTSEATAQTHNALLLCSVQVSETRGYIQHSSQQELNAAANGAVLLQAESYCLSGYFKTEQWANTGYTKCY